jgi:hypothetical protein
MEGLIKKMFARQNTPETQKEVVPNKKPEEALTQS